MITLESWCLTVSDRSSDPRNNALLRLNKIKKFTIFKLFLLPFNFILLFCLHFYFVCFLLPCFEQSGVSFSGREAR